MADEMTTVKRHLTEEDFKKWDAGVMTPEEMEAFLTHTSICDTCSENWMSFMASQEPEMLPEPPAYLADEIIARSQQPDLLIAQKVNHTSRQIRLLTYSLKVGTAVVLSIMMLFSINLTTMKISSVEEPSNGIELPFDRTEEADFLKPVSQNSSSKDNDSDHRAQYGITGHMRQGTRAIMTSLDAFTKSIFNFELNFNQED